LKFNRKKERGRDIYATGFNTLRINAAGSDLIGPEVPSGLVRLATQEIQIMPPDKEDRPIDWIRTWKRIPATGIEEGRVA
jgi:hypothetical protein